MSFDLPPEYANLVRRTLSAKRRDLANTSPLIFAKIYLPTLMSKPFSRMHLEIFQELAIFHTNRGSRLVIAAPRGHAKSTIVTLAYVLWCLVYGKEPFIVVASGTDDQAVRLLDHVKRQLESNALIRTDFPEVVPNGRVSPWKKDGIRLGNGTLLISCATSQNPRGVRHGEHRPTLFIADDLENKQLVASEAQRIKLADWFSGTFLKTGSPQTNTIVVGTVLHPESLLAKLLDPAKSPGWTVKFYKAVIQESSAPELWDRWRGIMRSELEYSEATGDAGAKLFLAANAQAMSHGAVVLWPGEYSYPELMKIRLQDGETAFQAEFQNEPMDPERCLFAGLRLGYWDDDVPTAEELIRRQGGGRFFGGCDPSLGQSSAGDMSAVIVIFVPHNSRKKFVIGADIKRRSPSEINRCILSFAELYDFHEFAVEANGFQSVMVTDLKRQVALNRYRVPVNPVNNHGNKVARILSLEAEISQGLLIFSRQHQVLLDQLRRFPCDKHDDGLDALEMAVSAANRFRGVATRIWT